MKDRIHIRNTVKGNILVRYSLLIAAAVAVTTIVTGVILVSVLENHYIRLHASLYAELSSTVRGEKNSSEAFIAILSRFPHVRSTAIWTASGASVMAPETGPLSGVGPLSRTAGKNAMNGALKGKLGIVPAPNEGLVILIPILTHEGAVEGIVGLLEDDTELRKDIQFVQLTVAATVMSVGVLLYALLFGIFLKANQEQKKAADRLRKTFDVIVFAMSSLSGLRDQETGGHLERTQAYTEVLLNGLRRSAKFRKTLDKDYIKDIITSAPLHDIGKVGIADSILLKKGKLEPGELESMRQHTVLGGDLLAKAANKLPFPSSLTVAESIARHHHERWDGSGYPDGLAGESIPLAARVVSLADVYDALRSTRPYKKAYSHEDAVRIIREGRGTQFDPDLVDVFANVESRFAEIFDTMKFD
ncbi:putative sensory transduction system regulatory protein (modular protein) [uncultured spirochete]|jgi:HD-GYP domain-containing protein (c-di-GMP phosphodiesterase class II)/type IV secretory pathway VirB3-like protein|uniref:Putative sensory transduction system regulatory protein (Modular protein) n=1 Tax=uncultured spirochete TaxID=156406 RepID=A0A3P3XJT5_9SPIR|nr:HD domain-containing phosphohydrolase [Rectinema subterraneum]SLM13402.1 putative sensory transduction system regulatory protein (modular protein) [uncultured spirochete]